jgi:cytochrome c oxidase subunit II
LRHSILVEEIVMKLKVALAITALVSTYSAGTLAAGDIERGKTLYTTCGACHGQNAEGMEALNAPALAGQEEWYTIRQLKNFKDGVRGSNPRDTYGMQMAPMAQVLPTDQAIEDVAAYIRSLKK